MDFFRTRITSPPALPNSSQLLYLRTASLSAHTESVNLLYGASMPDNPITQCGASSHDQVFSSVGSHVYRRYESTHDGNSGHFTAVNYATAMVNINPTTHQGTGTLGLPVSQAEYEYGQCGRTCATTQPSETLSISEVPPSEIEIGEDELPVLPDLEALCDDVAMNEDAEGSESISDSEVSQSLENSSVRRNDSEDVSDVLDELNGFLGDSDEVCVPFDDEALGILRDLRDGGDDLCDGLSDVIGNEVEAEGCGLAAVMNVNRNDETGTTSGSGYKAWTVSDYWRLQRVLRVHGAFNRAELMKVFPERSYEEVLERIRYYFPSALCVVREWSEEEHRRFFEIIGSVVDWRCVARRMRGRGVLDVRRYYYGLLRR